MRIVKRRRPSEMKVGDLYFREGEGYNRRALITKLYKVAVIGSTRPLSLWMDWVVVDNNGALLEHEVFSAPANFLWTEEDPWVCISGAKGGKALAVQYLLQIQ